MTVPPFVFRSQPGRPCPHAPPASQRSPTGRPEHRRRRSTICNTPTRHVRRRPTTRRTLRDTALACGGVIEFGIRRSVARVGSHVPHVFRGGMGVAGSPGPPRRCRGVARRSRRIPGPKSGVRPAGGDDPLQRIPMAHADMNAIAYHASDPSGTSEARFSSSGGSQSVWIVVSNTLFLRDIAWVAGSAHPVLERNKRFEPEVVSLALEFVARGSLISPAECGVSIEQALGEVWEHGEAALSRASWAAPLERLAHLRSTTECPADGGFSTAVAPSRRVPCTIVPTISTIGPRHPGAISGRLFVSPCTGRVPREP